MRVTLGRTRWSMTGSDLRREKNRKLWLRYRKGRKQRIVASGWGFVVSLFGGMREGDAGRKQ